MREAAGGAPDALRSTNKSATVRIGGELAIRYYANFDDNFHQQGQPQPSGGEYATRLGWTMDTASITFDVDFYEDVSMFIDVRPNYFDKAYIQWNNIGGSGLGSQIGLIGIPGGMYSSFDRYVEQGVYNRSDSKGFFTSIYRTEWRCG